MWRSAPKAVLHHPAVKPRQSNPTATAVLRIPRPAGAPEMPAIQAENDSTEARSIREMSILSRDYRKTLSRAGWNRFVHRSEARILGVRTLARPRFEVFDGRNAVRRRSRGDGLEIGIDVGQFVIGQHGRRIRRHVAVGVADIAFEGFEGQWLGRQ